MRIFFTLKSGKYISDLDGSEITLAMLMKYSHNISTSNHFGWIEFDKDAKDSPEYIKEVIIKYEIWLNEVEDLESLNKKKPNLMNILNEYIKQLNN